MNTRSRFFMDPDSAVIRSYGILNTGQGQIPHPTAVVIDRQGVAGFVRVDEDCRERPSSADLLGRVRACGRGTR